MLEMTLARSDEKAAAQPARRRTQEERSASTRKRLIDATLHCLGNKGYASTTLSQIIKQAGVSRGALLHHFPSKVELVAASMQSFYSQIGETALERLRSSNGERRSLRERIAIIRDVYAEHAPVRIEFMVAARTDPELAKTYLGLVVGGSASRYYPEFDDLDNPGAMGAVLSSFLIGHTLVSALQPDDEGATHELFVDIVEQYVELRGGRD